MSTAVSIYQGHFGRAALLECDSPLVTHAHPHCHVLVKISGADTRFEVREADYPLDGDTAILVNAWESHSYPHLNPGAPSALILALYIEPAWLAGLERAFAASAFPGFFPRACVALSRHERRLVDDLVIVMLAPPAAAVAELEARLAELMVALIEPHSGWRYHRTLARTGREQRRDRRVATSIAYLEANLSRKVDMGEVARLSGLSRAHFFELFRRSTRLSPEIYANALRMETALARLSADGASLVELSGQLGFSAPGHFTRFFRHHLGVTPSDYRRKLSLFGPRMPLRLRGTKIGRQGKPPYAGVSVLAPTRPKVQATKGRGPSRPPSFQGRKS
jgi:AraC-like DNA-binding protein